MSEEYTPPKIWTWNKDNGGRFAKINRPIAGATHEKELPVGKHPLQLYSLATPNGVKVTIMLEELLAPAIAGAEYDAWLIRISEGDQFGSGFVAVNPNSKIPALMDRSGPSRRGCSNPARSCSTSRTNSAPSCRRSAASAPRRLSWLFWQMGQRPYLGGGFGHFYAYAPIKIKYAIDRFAMEVKRQLDVLDRQLAEHDIWPATSIRSPTWRSGHGTARWSKGSSTTPASSCRCRNTARQSLGRPIAARPAVKRGRMVNRVCGEPRASCANATMPATSRPKTQDKIAAG